MATLQSPCLELAPWKGADLVRALEGWLKYGHVVEDDGPERTLNETAELTRMDALFSAWLKRQCKALNKELKGKLRHLSRNNTRHLSERAAMLRETLAKLDGFHKGSMSKAVQQSAFWRMPGKVANLVELQAKGAVQSCTTRLADTHAEQEARLVEWWAWMAEQAARREEQKRLKEEMARRTSPPPPRRYLSASDDEGDGAGIKRPTNGTSRTKGKKAKRRSARYGRKNATTFGATKPKSIPPLRQGREECFTVYD